MPNTPTMANIDKARQKKHQRFASKPEGADKQSDFAKLRDQFSTVVIGVLVGLPAVGIVIPQLFAMLGAIPGQQICGIFRVFAMLYFIMPLILLFGWSFFQFENPLFKPIRPLIYVGVGM